MIVYRISRDIYASDLTGAGAKMFGGRWNPKGVPVVYASQNRSLTALEFYAHRASSMGLSGLTMVSILIPDDAVVQMVSLASLPPDWDKYPYTSATVNLGAEWLESRESLLLGVPSVLIHEEYNYLINPEHPHMNRVSIAG
ncbi:MAG: RES domain protein [Syntrophorhabdaceae bacterium PtaU1.Bin034]|nr:MAG: RES domain protein [Syntrophorhabdaceae bacterium PtaU1.Bin034]